MIKKYFLLLTLAVAAISFTGCIDIIEEITLKKDGSGKFKYTVDMSGIMSGGMLEMLMSLDTSNVNQSPKQKLEMDQTTHLADKYDELKGELKNPELLKRLTHRMMISEKGEEAYSMFTLDFENLEEVSDFLTNMGKIQKSVDKKEEGQDSGGIGGMLGGLGEVSGAGSDGNNANAATYKGKKGKIQRIENLKPEKLDTESEDAAMVQMMLADSKYKTIYHFPGKVKKFSNDNSVLSNDKKTLTLEAGLLDYIQGTAKLDNQIKYKKR